MGQVKDIWTNETYANWLIDNGVPDKTAALCLVRWNGQAKQHRPVKVVSISKDFAGNDLVIPNDGNQYQRMGYIKLGENKFGVSVSETLKGKK